jgi:pimeloyl-ACP methyl ester carboxylesterase
MSPHVLLCSGVLGIASLVVGGPNEKTPPRAGTDGHDAAETQASAPNPPLDSACTFDIRLSAGESLSVESTGTGTPVVLLPGLFGAAFGFRHLVPLLVEAGYRAIVIEPLGIGQSSRPSSADYSLAAQSDRIAEAIDALGLHDVIVIAHSMGAAESFRLAYRHPRSVRGLISIEGGPTEQTSTPAFRRAIRLVSWFHMFGGLRLVRHEIRSSLVSSSGDSSWVTDTVVQGYTAPAAANLGAMLKSYLSMATAKEPELLAPHLGEIRAPVRMMIGMAVHDGAVTDDEVDLLKRTLPSFEVDTVPGAGHFIQEERPERVMVSLARLEKTLSGLPNDSGSRPSRSQ